MAEPIRDEFEAIGRMIAGGQGLGRPVVLPRGATFIHTGPLAADPGWTAEDIVAAVKAAPQRPDPIVIATPSWEALEALATAEGIPVTRAIPTYPVFSGVPVVITPLVDRPRVVPASLFNKPPASLEAAVLANIAATPPRTIDDVADTPHVVPAPGD